MAKKLLLIAVLTTLVGAQAQTVAPASGNITPALAKLDAYITDTMSKTKVPGLAVAVVYKGQVVFARGYGVRNLGEPAKVDPDTVFEIASVSKPLASTVMASLMSTEKGLSWDSRVKELDPGFALSDATATERLTLRDLFSHRSGLPTSAGDVLEDLGYSRPEILIRLRYVPLAGPFRESYHYSNFGLTEGAIAASLKTSKTWEELSEERLYAKIGMRSTSSRYSDYENRPNKAALHVLLDGTYRNWFVREADSEAPAGGVSSSANDLAKWMELQLNNGMFEGRQIVDREALEETHKPQMCTADKFTSVDQCPGNVYGLGWNVRRDPENRLTLSHSGAFLLGTSTSVFLVPDEQLGIVILVNGTPTGVPESVGHTFLDYFHYGSAKNDYQAIFRPIFDRMMHESDDFCKDYSKLQPPASPKAAAPLTSYQGTYSNPYYGDLKIEVQGDRLVLRLPPRAAYYELTHWDADTFTYYFASENTGIGRRAVKFMDGGKQVLVENLAIVNSGVFQKVD
jgi:CubicO group peptidase (beta-lactamase class C family)